VEIFPRKLMKIKYLVYFIIGRLLEEIA